MIFWRKVNGLPVPAGVSDAKKWGKVKEGEVVALTMFRSRSMPEHKKYFALIAAALFHWQDGVFQNEDQLRDALKEATGDMVPFKKLNGETLLKPRSHSFHECDQDRFHEHHQRVREIIAHRLGITDAELDRLSADEGET